MVQINLFSKLQSQEHPLLGPNMFLLKCCGMILPERKLQKFLWRFFQFIVILVGISEFIQYYFIITDKDVLISALKITMTSALCLYKLFSLLILEKRWRTVIAYSSRIEIRDRIESESYKDMKIIIKKYTRYSRIITYSYLILVMITTAAFICLPLLKFIASTDYRQQIKIGVISTEQVLQSWIPWDRNTIWGYSLSYCLEVSASIYTGVLIAAFDTTVIVLMVLFGGQIDLLKCRCARIFDSTDDVARERIIECCLIYQDLIKHARIFNSLLSPIMFLSALVCSIMFCTSAYQVLIMEVDDTERLVALQYLFFCVTQLFVYCWQSNEVSYKSGGLLRAPYESLWYTKRGSFRKDILIMTQQFRKTLTFTSGPFSDLTICTFINIVKGAYSYYTILSKT